MIDDNNAPIGAREKIRNARNANLMEGSFKGIGRGNYARRNGLGISLVIILAAAFVILLTELEMNDKALFFLPFASPDVNQALFGPGVADFFGASFADYSLTVFIRTSALLLVAGFLPFCTYLYAQLLDHAHASPYVTTWGVTVGLPLAAYVFAVFLLPLLETFYLAFFG